MTADTAFVATRAPGHGVDASHRGGDPGYLRCRRPDLTIVWPDYTGNLMFNTLGNIAVNPAMELTVTTCRPAPRSSLSGPRGGHAGRMAASPARSASSASRWTLPSASSTPRRCAGRLVHAARNPPLEPPRTGKYG